MSHQNNLALDRGDFLANLPSPSKIWRVLVGHLRVSHVVGGSQCYSQRNSEFCVCLVPTFASATDKQHLFLLGMSLCHRLPASSRSDLKPLSSQNLVIPLRTFGTIPTLTLDFSMIK